MTDGPRRAYTERTVKGATHSQAMTLMIRPDAPKLKRSFGSGLPASRLQITLEIVMRYEKSRATEVREMIALKPTAGPTSNGRTGEYEANQGPTN